MRSHFSHTLQCIKVSFMSVFRIPHTTLSHPGASKRGQRLPLALCNLQAMPRYACLSNATTQFFVWSSECGKWTQVYDVQVCLRVQAGNGMPSCIFAEDDMMGKTYPFLQRPRSSSSRNPELFDSKVGAGLDESGAWVLQTLTVSSFVVATADDEALRRR